LINQYTFPLANKCARKFLWDLILETPLLIDSPVIPLASGLLTRPIVPATGDHITASRSNSGHCARIGIQRVSVLGIPDARNLDMP